MRKLLRWWALIPAILVLAGGATIAGLAYADATTAAQHARAAEQGNLQSLGKFLDEVIAGTALSDADIDPDTLSINGTAVTSTAAELNILDGVTSTAAELNKSDDSAVQMTAGAGIAGIDTYATGVFRNGNVVVTRMVLDLTDLVVDDADLDIIGDDDAASANFGQITSALNGTIVAIRMTCLEVPAGAGTVVDIDLYSATEGTGTEGVATGIAALTETALITSGASWTSGRVLGSTAVPAAAQYLYLVAGAAGGDSSAFTAGKFLIELYGTP